MSVAQGDLDGFFSLYFYTLSVSRNIIQLQDAQTLCR